MYFLLTPAKKRSLSTDRLSKSSSKKNPKEGIPATPGQDRGPTRRLFPKGVVPVMFRCCSAVEDHITPPPCPRATDEGDYMDPTGIAGTDTPAYRTVQQLRHRFKALPRMSQLYTTLHLAPMLIGCRLLLAIRCCARFTSSGITRTVGCIGWVVDPGQDHADVTPPPPPRAPF